MSRNINFYRPAFDRWRSALLLLSAVALTSLLFLYVNEADADQSRAVVECNELIGMAGIYPCHNVDLLAVVPTVTLSQGGTGNDLWGWTDPETGREYAIMGHSLGTSFTDVTDPVNPVYLGYLPSGSLINALWRDMEVYNNHMYTVGDFSPALQHGLQIFDLTELRDPPPLSGIYAETARYMGFDEAHNFAINVDTGFGYAVGSEVCSGGLEMLDLSNPVAPVQVGCFDEDGYTHDVQCVSYHGPDSDHQGSEICMAANEDTLTVVDVTDKQNPVMLSRVGYAGVGYSHQGWLTEDHAYFLLGDELDEQNNGHNTRTYIWDVRDLDNIEMIGFYDGSTESIDHNLYIVDGLAFEANYNAGLQILDLTHIAAAQLSEVGYFDTIPAVDVSEFAGSWSVYPFFESKTIIVSNLEEGLYVLRYNLPNIAIDMTASHPAEPTVDDIVDYTITVSNTGTISATDIIVTNIINGESFVISGPTSLAPDTSTTFTHSFRISKPFCDALSATATTTTAQGVGASTLVPLETDLACVPTAVTLAGGAAAHSPLSTLLVAGLLLLFLTALTVVKRSSKHG